MQPTKLCLVVLAFVTAFGAWAHDSEMRIAPAPQAEGARMGGGDEADDEHLDRDRLARDGSERIEVERDAGGRERRSGEVLMLGDAAAVAAVVAAGYPLISQRTLSSLGLEIARLGVKDGQTVEKTLIRMIGIAPLARLAPNHLYRPSEGSGGVASMAALQALPRSALPALPGTLIGVIDGGADTTLPALNGAVVRTQGFAAGGYAPRAHGSLVAAIAGSGGAQLAVADVFGTDGENRLVAAAETIASAIDWLLADQVAVINISIEGPENLVLSQVIRWAVARGMAIVAAAGNGGPAAAAVYPAAYPGVIAVTATDENHQVYRRANRGDYIAFAALGVRVKGPAGVEGLRPVSGTSFATPVVAAELARRLAAEPGSSVAKVLVEMQDSAIDLGIAGRDPIYGWGLVQVPVVLGGD